MATSNGSTAIRDKILASLARYRALRIGKFPCAFWRLSSRPGLTAIDVPLPTGFSQIESQRVSFNIQPDQDQRMALLQMTPFAWRANAATQNKIQHAKDLIIETDFILTLASR
ncbi:hypothetical protein [Bathymodiolus platifrons methanotrophic gill symbiont]|uniref:hypothetical protein n=1 Tax=Bathymodiolus platifrons methanotrophic gill symbiont TaxID=113268 RepID=UPI001C8E7A4C|nr:hypothetical protein [Bathymodiolus platifrons methanotrophic gill symbiont]